MSGVEANTDAMEAHSKTLTGEIVPGLQKAHDASTQVQLGPEVMGQLCQMWSFIFNDEVAAAEEMLRQLPKAMDATGNRVLDAARDFREREERNKANFEGLNQ